MGKHRLSKRIKSIVGSLIDPDKDEELKGSNIGMYTYTLFNNSFLLVFLLLLVTSSICNLQDEIMVNDMHQK